MKFTLWNDITGKYLKVINVIDMRIEKIGDKAEQGFQDTQQWFIVYTIQGKNKMDVFKEYRIEYKPSYDHLQIISEKN